MILTGPKLEEIGKALYGPVWVSMLSKKLRCTKRTVMRRAGNPRAMPAEMQRALIDLIDEQFSILAEKRDMLAQTFDDVA